ncbi:hypothetical protein QVD17_41565 [Tagetes erecta]|uniref:non-specific serine/threonine protein kinase n=1 Tax=Tagetes erecta TaxID=13708 RepID=A0AAD8JMX7_TARER|nr:hypothetical protein QVD17_41565 [Tagetes erecta]
MQICHRDLKIENTLLDGSPAPRLKICDFGYSKSSLLHSRPKSTVGTPAYIAPEVLSRKEYDGKNCKMQCTVMKKFGAQFRHMLQENQSIYINNPALAENRAKYKHVDLPHKIIFDKDTTVQIYNDFKGSVHGFGFAKFEDIISKKVGENDLIDVIGCIVNREPVKYSILEDGKQIPRLSVKLEDEKGEIVFLTLWQSYCENLMKFIVEHDDAVNVIIILQHGKVKWFQGNPYVNNSFSVARVFINSDIEEISLFKTRYHKKSVDAVSTSQHSISSVVESIQDDFVSDKSFCFISDIPEIDEAKSIILVGTIKGVVKEVSW